LQDLFNEVFAGNYVNFRQCLTQTSCQTLKLSQKMVDIQPDAWSHFGLALQGTSVKCLDLSLNKIDDASISRFAPTLKNTALIALKLTHNCIGPQGAYNLGQNLVGTKIIKLDLAINILGDSGAIALGQTLVKTPLQQLNLAFNQIGYNGAYAFGKSLNGTAMTHIDLARNKLSTMGSFLLGTTVNNTKLHYVNLNGNRIGDDGLASWRILLSQSQLLKLKFDSNLVSPSMTQAMQVEITGHRNMLLMAPYLYSRLRFLSPTEKAKHFGSVSKKQQPLNYAGGILMRTELPCEIFCHILNYLPLMRTKTGSGQAKNYLQLAQKHQLKRNLALGSGKSKLTPLPT
jgi:hypothetical protein